MQAAEDVAQPKNEPAGSLQEVMPMSDADRQWVEEAAERLVSMLHFEYPQDPKECKAYLSTMVEGHRKLLQEVRNRKRSCTRRKEACDAALEALSVVEEVSVETIKLIKLVGSATFSGDEAIQLFEKLATCLESFVLSCRLS